MLVFLARLFRLRLFVVLVLLVCFALLSLLRFALGSFLTQTSTTLRTSFAHGIVVRGSSTCRSGRCHLIAALRLVGSNIIIDRISQLQEEVDGGKRHTNGIRLGVTRHQPRAILGVHRRQSFQIQTAGSSDLRQTNVARHHHGVRFDGHTRLHRGDVVIAIIVHHVVSSDESRHISTSFAREIRINRPIIFHSSGALDGFGNITRTTVVSRNGECPIVVAVVEFFEIARSCPTRFDGIAAFIDQTIDGESELSRCGDHELPQPSSTHTTCGSGFERTLDDGEIVQFQR